MTQIASLLAVPTVFIGLWLMDSIYLHFTIREGGGAYTRDKLKLKSRVLMGRNRNILWYFFVAKLEKL